MFDSMDSNIINTFIKIANFHSVSVYFHKAKGSFNSCSEWFQFFIDLAVRHCRSIFSVSVFEVCITAVAKLV